MDNRRRWVIAAQAAAVAVAALVLLALLVAAPVWSAGKLVGLLLIGIVPGFAAAVVNACKAWRGGPLERFEVYDLGIAHTTKDGQRAWTWQQITQLQCTRTPGRLPRYGWDFSCAVRFTDGATIGFNGLTADAPAIVDVLYAQRPDAVVAPDTLRGWRLLRWVAPFVAAGCAWCIVIVFRMLNDDRTTVPDGPGSYRVVPKYDDSTIALLAIGGLVCVVAFVVSLSYLAVGLVQSRRR
ncbi:hypothetical protein [Amycolatopsis sp. cmx-4-54]|uniref:hypothetical protein n=1 Tax=Amycolatopsis sp. cmx-4-54 TaxID=2790936 RepID=UPI0039785E6F